MLVISKLLEAVVPKKYGSYPDVEIKILVGDRFDVETDGGYRGDDLANLTNHGQHALKLRGRTGIKPSTGRAELSCQRYPAMPPR